MPTVLAAQPGSVKVLNDASVQATIPALVAFDSPELSFDSELSIINAIGIQESTNHQFMHSLGADIYIYTFGDRMGQLQIGGLAFAKQCGERGGNIEHGLGRIRRFYANNKLSTRPDPVQLVIGNSPNVVEGFITSFTAQVADVASRLVAWQLGIALIPEVGEGGGGGGGNNIPVGVSNVAGTGVNTTAPQNLAPLDGPVAGASVEVVRRPTGPIAGASVEVVREPDRNVGGSGNWASAQQIRLFEINGGDD